MLNKVLDSKEIIGIEKSDDAKVLIDIDDELPDDITFKKVVTKDSNKFYSQLFLGHALYIK